MYIRDIALHEHNFHWDRFGIVEGRGEKIGIQRIFSLFSHFKVLLLCWLATDSLSPQCMPHTIAPPWCFSWWLYVQLLYFLLRNMCNARKFFWECETRESIQQIAHCASKNCNLDYFFCILSILSSRLALSYCTWIIVRVYNY